MAYDKRNLSVLAFANGFTFWHYTTTDTGAMTDTAGYFNGSADMVRVGDIVLANVDVDGTPGAEIFLVNDNAGGVIDIARLAFVMAPDNEEDRS